MMQRVLLIVASLAIGLASAVALAVGAPGQASAATTLQRIYGQDAIATSIAVSKAQFPQNGSSASVVLARSDHFADALAGGPLAAVVNGPLLITLGATLASTLDPRVVAEIQRVLPTGRTVYVLGGALALPSGIDTALRGLGFVVTRLQGANQFATAVAIANALGTPSAIFEATGLHFADALSAVPAAIKLRGAILLTNGNQQSPETAAYLSTHGSIPRYAIGGPLAAAGADPSATAIYGQDLFGTSTAVASRFFPSGTAFGAATGLNFSDALAGGVFMGGSGHVGAVLLVNRSAPLPPSVAGYLLSLPGVSSGYLFGGPLAVGDDVVTALQHPIVAPPPPPPPPPPPVDVATEVINLTNQQRAAAGLGPLISDGRLNAAAAGHSADMAARNTLSHTSSNGASLGDRATAAGYRWFWVGENIAFGYSTPAAVVNGWMNSQSHRDNILNPYYYNIGVGLAYTAGGTPYWTMDLGIPA